MVVQQFIRGDLWFYCCLLRFVSTLIPNKAYDFFVLVMNQIHLPFKTMNRISLLLMILRGGKGGGRFGSSRRLWLHVEHSPRHLPSPAWLLHCLGARACIPITIHNHRVKKTVLLFFFPLFLVVVRVCCCYACRYFLTLPHAYDFGKFIWESWVSIIYCL